MEKPRHTKFYTADNTWDQSLLPFQHTPSWFYFGYQKTRFSASVSWALLAIQTTEQ